VYAFPSDRHETVSSFGRPAPSIGEEAGSGEVVAPASPAVPAPFWEKRQPQMRRSVLPVEWFRRMPGGTTTYAPPAADLTVDSGEPTS
jgi:hypothetical protein